MLRAAAVALLVVLLATATFVHASGAHSVSDERAAVNSPQASYAWPTHPFQNRVCSTFVNTQEADLWMPSTAPYWVERSDGSVAWGEWGMQTWLPLAPGAELEACFGGRTYEAASRSDTSDTLDWALDESWYFAQMPPGDYHFVWHYSTEPLGEIHYLRLPITLALQTD